MKLSIVTTLYSSSPYIDEFYRRITTTAEDITDDYELVFVNDGSKDDSLEKAIELYNNDSHIRIIDLSRNFGHHKAIMTGLSHAEGDYVFLIDCDLEEEPELLKTFCREIKNEKDIDVVFGVQESRKGGFFERWSGRFFYTILNKLIDDIKYPVDTLTARIMTKRYVHKILEYKESEYDLWSIFEFAGFNTKSIVCRKGCKNSTAYTFFKKMDMATHIVVSTSKKPLQLIFYLGFIIAFISFLYLIYLFSLSFFFDVPMGWTSIVVLLSLIMGVLIFSIGILGIYISVIFLETKNRPVIIKAIYQEGYSNE